MDLFSLVLVCACIAGILFYSEQRSLHDGLAELPVVLVALGMTLRLLVAVVTLTAVAMSMGAI